MSLSARHSGWSRSLLLATYGALWTLARPALKRNARLRPGFSQRMAPEGWADPADLWVQAASGGEAYLAWELLRHLPAQPLQCLLTTCTQQGLAILENAQTWCAEHRPELHIQTRYLPFDHPAMMARAVRAVSPRAVALLETELWPGLLDACRDVGVPVAVLNARMNTRSLTGYLTTRSLWQALRPTTILAISETDARRFATLFGEAGVQSMSNMKFDRVSPVPLHADTNPLADTVIRSGTSVITLGSVRKEEETAVRHLVEQLHSARPKTTIALFPRHMERVPHWETALTSSRLPVVRRSKLTDAPAAPGSVILWDVFGELNHAYALSRAVFVGGSLAPLGGQNTLEPLAHGICPVTGPSDRNFAWARDLQKDHLVHREPDADAVLETLLRLVKRPSPREEIQRRFTAWLQERQGGSQQAADALMALLLRTSHSRKFGIDIQ